MHASSFENMRRCIDWYLGTEAIEVVDLGSMNVNGSYRDLFPEETRYVGVDLEAGPGVDFVLEDFYQLPFDSASIDLVISGQMLERCGQFWRVFKEIERILRPEGKAFIIAPSAGPVRRHSIDGYRFYPDSFKAIADWSKLRLVHSYTDERGPWCDSVGVFQKGGSLERVARLKPRKITANYQVATHSDPALEKHQGSRHYIEVLNELHEIIRPNLYVEIGVRKGASFCLSRGRAVGIDPDPDPNLQLPTPEAQLFRCTSDDFFFFHGRDAFPEPAQLAFIDGMHLAEFVLRDFMNLERCMSADGVIVVDDVLPNHPVQAQRERCSMVWTGDVWRFAERLAELRPKLRLTWLDTDPTGLLVISGLNPADRKLWSDYNMIARRFDDERDSPPPAHLIDRSRTLKPTTQNIRAAAGRISRFQHPRLLLQHAARVAAHALHALK